MTGSRFYLCLNSCLKVNKKNRFYFPLSALKFTCTVIFLWVFVSVVLCRVVLLLMLPCVVLVKGRRLSFVYSLIIMPLSSLIESHSVSEWDVRWLEIIITSGKAYVACFCTIRAPQRNSFDSSSGLKRPLRWSRFQLVIKCLKWIVE